MPLTMLAVVLFGLYVVRTPKPIAMPVNHVDQHPISSSYTTGYVALTDWRSNSVQQRAHYRNVRIFFR